MKPIALSPIALITVALFAACGGSSNTPPSGAALQRTFTYGSTAAPTGAESTAVTDAQGSLSTTTTLTTTPSADSGAAILAMSETLADAALGSTGLPAGFLPSKPELAKSIRNTATTCGTVVGNTITFANCSYAESGLTLTINGSVTTSAGNVTWSVSSTFAGTVQSVTVNLAANQAGNINVSNTAVTGNATTDALVSASGNGQSLNFGFSTAAIFNLTVTSTPNYCISGGSLEVRRIWTSRPSGYDSTQLKDAGVKMTWTACNTFQVSHSQ